MRSMSDAGLDPKRFVTLSAGMDTEVFHPRWRDESIWERLGPSPPGTIRVLSCGRVSIEKNLPMLVKAWQQAESMFKAAGTRAQLVVVGDGPYLATMKAALSQPGGSGPPPLFLGFRHGAELSALYASADLFVFPSTTDTLGQAVMEAQASGLPALVSDQGGPKGIIEPGRTGFVLPGSDAAAWARAIAELASDPSRRRDMGLAAHRRMQSFGFAKSFDHFWSVHEQAVADSVHSPA
jgi:glycosyltransferase involved in cell wall biosynthesis